MSQTAVLVWLSAASLLPTFHADLAAFAASRLVRLEAPRENAAPFRASAYAPDAVAQVESSLEEARSASASLEQDRALGALDRAKRLLRDHPELPQSAWLMAEALQLSADVEASAPGGSEAALRLRTRAAALEGTRATPFEDRAPGDMTTAPTPEPRAPASEDRAPAASNPQTVVASPRSIAITGVEPGDDLQWDGQPAVSYLAASSGEHHTRVLRNGRLIWAGWVVVESAASELRLPVPETVACSADDLAEAHFEGGRAWPAPHARCDSYVLARARSAGGIEAALCERGTCDKVVLWERERAPAATPRDAKRIWPYAVAVSAGVLALAGLVLWRAGAFNGSDPGSKSVWVYNPSQNPMTLGF